MPSFSPPQAPPSVHRELYGSLPSWESGTGESRIERARAFLKQGREQVHALHLDGTSGLSICRLLSRLHDTLTTGLFTELVQDHPRVGSISLLALGGYGRRELSPHSDLDLLLLRPGKV